MLSPASRSLFLAQPLILRARPPPTRQRVVVHCHATARFILYDVSPPADQACSARKLTLLSQSHRDHVQADIACLSFRVARHICAGWRSFEAELCTRLIDGSDLPLFHSRLSPFDPRSRDRAPPILPSLRTLSAPDGVAEFHARLAYVCVVRRKRDLVFTDPLPPSFVALSCQPSPSSWRASEREKEDARPPVDFSSPPPFIFLSSFLPAWTITHTKS